jgi:hypothetical protein
MPGKDSAAVVVLLAEPQSSHTGAFESEVEAADGMPENRLPTVSGVSDIGFTGESPHLIAAPQMRIDLAVQRRVLRLRQ